MSWIISLQPGLYQRTSIGSRGRSSEGEATLVGGTRSTSGLRESSCGELVMEMYFRPADDTRPEVLRETELATAVHHLADIDICPRGCRAVGHLRSCSQGAGGRQSLHRCQSQCPVHL